MSEEIIVGRNSVTEALRGGRSINKLLVQDGIKGGSIGEIINLAKEQKLLVEFVKIEKLNQMSQGLRHQGVIALGAPVRFYDLEEVLEKAKSKGQEPFLLLLDELQDPQNVGALIRTADAAGVHGILMPQRRSCPLNAVVAKISAGAVEYVPTVKIGNITQTINELKAKGYYVKQQYLIEKRRSDAAKMAYQAGIDHFTNGKAISEASEIYQKNVDFLRGYKEALEKSQTNNKTR